MLVAVIIIPAFLAVSSPGVSRPSVSPSAVPCPGIKVSSPATLSTTPPVGPLSPCQGVVVGTYFGDNATDWAIDVSVDADRHSYVVRGQGSTAPLRHAGNVRDPPGGTRHGRAYGPHHETVRNHEAPGDPALG